MAISKLPTTASLKQVMDKFEEISLADFSSIDIITASELPLEGKEGRLCIITNTTPGNIYVNYEKPSLLNGDIFIKYELVPSYDSYKVIAKNTSITLKIRNIIQNANGVETVVYGYIYTNGAWNRLVPETLYVFKKSVGLLQDISYTTSITRSGMNISEEHGWVSCTHTSNSIVYKYHSSHSCSVVTNLDFSQIDLSSYKYLHIDYECTCTYPWDANAPRISLQVVNQGGATVVNSSYAYSEKNNVWSIARNTAKLDVSNLSGLHTIRLQGSMNNSYQSANNQAPKVTIHNMTLRGEVL